MALPQSRLERVQAVYDDERFWARKARPRALKKRLRQLQAKGGDEVVRAKIRAVREALEDQES